MALQERSNVRERSESYLFFSLIFLAGGDLSELKGGGNGFRFL